MSFIEEIQENSMIGKRVGVYELKREIGRGGMGAVYLAERADGEFRQKGGDQTHQTRNGH